MEHTSLEKPAGQGNLGKWLSSFQIQFRHCHTPYDIIRSVTESHSPLNLQDAEVLCMEKRIPVRKLTLTSRPIPEVTLMALQLCSVWGWRGSGSLADEEKCGGSALPPAA